MHQIERFCARGNIIPRVKGSAQINAPTPARTQRSYGVALSYDQRPLNFVTSVAILGSRIRFLP